MSLRFICILSLNLLFCNAFANCVDLVGTYSTCISSTEENSGRLANVVVTQSNENGVSVYHITSTDTEDDFINEENYIANGAMVKTDVKNFRYEVTANCSKESLKYDENIYFNGSLFSKSTSVVSKENGSLVMKVNGYFETAENSFDEVITCK